MKHLLLSILFLSLFFCSTSAQDNEGLDAILSEITEDDAGIGIGITKDGELVHFSSKGLANIQKKEKIILQSNFRLASTSKQFTAACIIHLSQEGHIDLEDQLSNYLPDLSEELGKVRIHQLLHHTSGIRDYMSLLMIKGSDQMDFFDSYQGDDDYLLRLIHMQKDLSFEAGSKHSYSNTNYWLLGQIVKKVSGISLGNYAKKYIFGPLGMKHTQYLEEYQSDISNKVIGYVSKCPDCEREEYVYETTAVGDGGIRSNIVDLLKWENEFYNCKILTKKAWDKMTEKGVLNDGTEINYASGLIIDKYQEQKVIKHSGQNPGFTSQILKFPELKMSIIVLGNQNWIDARDVANKVADVMLKKDGPDQKETSTKINEVSLSKEDLDEFNGVYKYKETGEIRSIKNTPRGLMYLRENGPTSRLVPLSQNTFTYEERNNVRMTISIDANQGKSIEWYDGNRTMHATEYIPLTLPSRQLKRYIGQFHSQELESNIKISAKSGQLRMKISGKKIPLENVEEDEFSAMGIFKVRFIRNEEKTISGFRLDAPRAANILFQMKT